ncbi:MAG TPA: hypothetical protein VL285_20450 [Bryobacteraceae bacterium]|nr:hypothetical protein [Bryobacteraceae bacterium]
MRCARDPFRMLAGHPALIAGACIGQALEPPPKMTNSTRMRQGIPSLERNYVQRNSSSIQGPQ